MFGGRGGGRAGGQAGSDEATEGMPNQQRYCSDMIRTYITPTGGKNHSFLDDAQFVPIVQQYGRTAVEGCGADQL